MASNQPILVVVSLRGGCDGLNLVGPSADPIYLTERKPEARVERGGDTPGLLLPNSFADLDFRFHFKATKLHALYNAKQLAIVHAVGLTNGTRSHFEAIDYMERGTPDDKSTSTGWLTRLVAASRLKGTIPAVATSDSVPPSLLACREAVAISSVGRIRIEGGVPIAALLKQYYTGANPITACGLRSLGVVDAVAAKAMGNIKADYVPSPGVVYLGDQLGNGLKTAAQLIKMDIGVQVATVDYGGWDTHVAQPARFPNQVNSLSTNLGAFWDDLAAHHPNLTVVVVSEFGRRLRSNDSGGTDHGHGNAMLVLGGNVKGGNIYGTWPGLDNAHLDNGADLAITTDYRSVFAEVLRSQFQLANAESIFPKLAATKPLGFI